MWTNTRPLTGCGGGFKPASSTIAMLPAAGVLLIELLAWG